MPQKTAFHVVHVSGQDENYKASELNTHSPTTKGWQSSRFCLYPQDIVVQMDKRVRLKKIQILSHQYLIATKIEFYVGDVPEMTPVSLQNARYTRLGYVALSDNEKTGYKARELKSVHVDAVGLYVKFVIHKNHVNKHNLYNQVGIVAINVIGDDIHPSTDLNYPHIKDDRLENDPSLAGLFNRYGLNLEARKRPDYISPLDDLAFDMYQDPECAQIIRKLEKKKQEAVLQERYDFAKRLKTAIQELQKVGEKLGKYEVEKRQAVESEDYDKAKLKKVQMDEYRLQVYKELEISDLLELAGHRFQIDLEPTRQATPPRLTELPVSPLPRAISPPLTPYEERPLPAIKSKPEDSPSPPAGPSAPYDDRPLPSQKAGEDDQEINIDDQSVASEPLKKGNVTGEPEQMTEKDQREAGAIIDVFELPLVSKAYSKNWSFREDALLEIQKIMEEMPTTTPKDEAKTTMRAANLLLIRALKDKVFAVFTAALNLLKMILTEYVPSHKIPRSDTATTTERTLPCLLQKTGDTAVRMRDSAKNFIIEESKFPEVKPLHVLVLECVKPFKTQTAPRLAISRVELLHTLYKEHGLKNGGLTVDNLMLFCTQALLHNAGEVRERSERIIIELYKDAGAPVKDYLPPDNEKTRKNVLYKQMFEAFDRIDGKPSKDDLKRRRQEEEATKQKEIAELQAQIAAMKAMRKGDAPVDESILKDDVAAGRKQPKKKKPPAKEKEESVAPPDDTGSVLQIENMCIFCGEKNEAFTEEGLDLHYWKSCPMLKRCSFCKQVVEIAGFTDHLLTECENKDQHKRCPRCTEAIPKSDFDAHDKAKACPPAEAGKNHCPMCHSNIPQGEDGWKNHLMGNNGCKQNPRRKAKDGKKGANKPAYKGGGVKPQGGGAKPQGGGAKPQGGGAKPQGKGQPPSKGGSRPQGRGQGSKIPRP